MTTVSIVDPAGMSTTFAALVGVVVVVAVGVERPTPGRRAAWPRPSRVSPAAPRISRLGIRHLVGAAAVRVWRKLSKAPTIARNARPSPHRRSGRLDDANVTVRIGGALLAAVVALLFKPWMVPMAAGLLWWTPSLEQARAQRRVRERVVDELPEVADVLLLAVSGGANVFHAVDLVGRRLDGHIADQMRDVIAATRSGTPLADALDRIPQRLGEPARPLVAALAASDRYGAPLSASLQRLADEARAGRRRRIEEQARKVPVKLLFPLICCTLPAFALLTIAPLIAGGLRALRR